MLNTNVVYDIVHKGFLERSNAERTMEEYMFHPRFSGWLGYMMRKLSAIESFGSSWQTQFELSRDTKYLIEIAEQIDESPTEKTILERSIKNKREEIKKWREDEDWLNKVLDV